jgi:RNA polymerase sigma factor (sigma-70 family)
MLSALEATLSPERFLPRSRRLLAALSDERLVKEVRRGNEASFEAIYDRHHGGLLAFSRHMLDSLEDAEDVLQHTFTSAYRALREGEQPRRLKPWLYTIARNRSFDVLRARRPQGDEGREQSTGPLSEEVEQRAELRALLADVGNLPERQRSALVLATVGGLNYLEIGEVLECEPKHVKSLVFEARSALIKERAARETPCLEIREEIASAEGRALRRGLIRRHVRSCEGCAEFEKEVRRQRTMLALVLPVVPSLGLKESALAAAGIGGGAAGGGGLVAIAGGAGVAKILAGVAVGGAIGGVVATQPQLVDRARLEVERAANVVLEAWRAPSASEALRDATRDYDEALRRAEEEGRLQAEDAARRRPNDARADARSPYSNADENDGSRDKGDDGSRTRQASDEPSGGGGGSRSRDDSGGSGKSSGGGGSGVSGGSGDGGGEGGLEAPRLDTDLDRSSPFKLPDSSDLPLRKLLP